MGHAERLIRAARRLSDRLAPVRFGPPVTHVYDPTRYAARGTRRYLRRFADGPKRVLFLGMNPGPHGMAQTGVPFGEIHMVRDWMGIEERIDRPRNEHPRRPIEGFACRRSEVSGARLWGAIAERWSDPKAFFREHFVANYCPLVFMEASGRNRTPDKLPAHERDAVYAACDDHLRRVVAILDPEWVVGIGAFAETRARAALADRDLGIGRILHPSPASPRANRGWAEQAWKDLRALGLCSPSRAEPSPGR
ncbi:MAG TPA: single-strand selective monofunctional uracil-DNA glycosylase [Deltaproteobacteria bacterium]|nr:single-strand selective monofunctional uracil-DNA glycosylase [Deltaproteobacteria bacterium]